MDSFWTIENRFGNDLEQNTTNSDAFLDEDLTKVAQKFDKLQGSFKALCKLF